MTPALPDRAAARRKNWHWQVDWKEHGEPCFVRFQLEAMTTFLVQSLADDGIYAIVTDLDAALDIGKG